MDLHLEDVLINQLFADALARATAKRLGFIAALDVDGRLFQRDGEKVPAKVKLAFRELVGAIAADGVLTAGERAQLVAFFEEHGLTLEPPASAQRSVDIDGVELPDLL